LVERDGGGEGCGVGMIEPRMGIAPRKAALGAKLAKRLTCHTFRHSFATHPIEGVYDIRPLQEPLGHRHVTTTMIYAHVLNRGGLGVASPRDGL
jgi:site-specific recombinase XerD